MPNKEILLRYAELKIQIGKLEEEAELIKPLILQEVAAIRGDSDQPVALQELPGYSFDIRKGKRKWTYTVGTQNMEKQLKEIQKEEQAIGKATAEEGEPYPIFNTPK